MEWKFANYDVSIAVAISGMFRDMFRSRGYTNNNSSLDWDWNMIDQGSGAGPGVPESDNNMMDGSADGKRQ
eukprot:scaffold106709_cov31-Attheya_sp.AAC.1